MIFMHYLFIQQMIIEHLYGSGTVLDIRDTTVNKQTKLSVSLPSCSLHSSEGGEGISKYK